MKHVLLLGLIAISACAGEFGAGDDDACSVTVSYTPAQPLAGPDTEIRVTSTVSNAFGTLSYHWGVLKGSDLVDFEDAQSDHSEITFLATESGAYDVTLDVSPSSGGFCPQGRATVNVLTDLEGMKARLHVTPPASAGAPVIDRPLTIHDAMDFDMGAVVLEPGVIAAGQVRSGSTQIPAYLQFTPKGMDGAMVETFTTGTGAFSVRLLDQPHDVVVVPMIAGFAPQRLSYTPSSTLISIGSGQTLIGNVHQGATKIANAKVQLTIDGVPTTLATTDANGDFTTLGVPISGATVKVEVTPAAASGLPRLEATGDLTVTGAIDVNYTSLTMRNLSGVPVRRGGAAQATKNVSIVGTIAAAGTITAGTVATATGYLRISTTTDAAGALPSQLAPAGPLYAVTTIAPGDLAVGAVDLTAGVPAQIDAPPPVAFAADAKGGTDNLPGALLDLVPTGPAQLAGAPALHFTANGNGHVAGVVPANMTFDVRWTDPAGVRAPLVIQDTAQLAVTYQLPSAVYITGELTVTGSTNPVIGASVQVLCDACTGLEKLRPIAEVASDPHGAFSLAVPDPGAM
jgi:hypothetical protein